MTAPLIVSYGGGVNSTAVLVGLWERLTRPGLILFADTGGEKPETYAYLDVLATWLGEVCFPQITVVQNDGKYKTLERNCLEKKMLPSLAYGFKSCSDKYKRRPQDKFSAQWAPAVEAWERGEKVTKAIGYDAGEERRAGKSEDDKYAYWYPLIQWGWWRDDCLMHIRAAGLPVPPKSACFFCPASTKREIFALAEAHTDLYARAVAMERTAEENLDTVKGLGRRFAWGELLEKDRLALPLFRADFDTPPVEQTCMCFDGDD
jgi:hypothetical protein